MIDIIQLRMVFELLIAVTMWPFLLGVYLILASRQWRAGEGNAGQLWRVAGLAATLASLPMLIWLVVLLPPYSAETNWWFALALTAVSAFWVAWNLWRLMGGPLTAVPVDMNLDSNKQLQRNMQRIAERMGTEIPMPELYKLTTEGGGLLPGELLIDSRGGNHVYTPKLESPDSETHELTGVRLVVAVAPGECWWQFAVLPFAAVCACFSSAFVGEIESAAVGVVAFVAARWVVKWMFKRSRGEEPVYFIV